MLALGGNTFGWWRQKHRTAPSVPGAVCGRVLYRGEESTGCLERQSGGDWLRDLFSTIMSTFKGPRSQVITDTGYREESGFSTC